MKNQVFFLGVLLSTVLQAWGYHNLHYPTMCVGDPSHTTSISDNVGLQVSTYQVVREVNQLKNEEYQNSKNQNKQSQNKTKLCQKCKEDQQRIACCDESCKVLADSLKKDGGQKSLDRCNAVEQTVQTRYAKEERDYNFSVEEEVVLHAHGIDVEQFKRIPGTVLQHHLFQETVMCIKEVSRAAWKFAHYMSNGSEIVSETLELSMLSCDLTKSQAIPLAMKVNDACELLANYTIRICLQTVDSVFGFVGAVMNPKEIIEHIAASLVPLFSILGESLAFADNQGCLPCAGLVVDEEQYWKNIAHINKGFEVAKRQFCEKSFEDKLFATTQLACDCCIHTALLAKIGRFFSGLWRRAIGVPYVLYPIEFVVEQEYQVLKRLPDGLELVEPIVAGKQLPMNTEAFSLQNIYSDTSFADVIKNISSQLPTYIDVYECLLEKQVQIIGKDFYNLLPVDKKAIVDAGGILSQRAGIVDQQAINDIVKEVENCFQISEYVQQEITILKEKYSFFTSVINGEKIKIAMDIEHIFVPRPKLRFSKNGVLRDVEITGWHYDLWQIFFDQGLITILKKHETSDGCVFLDMFWKYGKTEFDKTFFPRSWSREKCVEKIMEAFKVAKPIGKRNTAKNRTLRGITKEGILIEIRMSKNIENIWHIDTAFVAKNYFGVKA